MRHLLSSLAFALFFAGCATTSHDPPRPDPVKILEVTSAEIVVLKTRPRQLVVKATGKTSSAGWTHLRLVPTGRSRDGVHEFSFIGEPPVGTVAQVLTPVTGTYMVPVENTDLRVAQIVSKSNRVNGILNPFRSTR